MERTKLKSARTRKYWTQKQAAAFAGVNERTYRMWELGTMTPRPSSVQLLCNAFGATAEDLDLEAERHIISISPSCLDSRDITLCLMAVAFAPPRPYSDVQQQVESILEDYDMHEGDPIPRREALLRLLALPFFAALRPGLTARRSEDVITQCCAGIAACWELSKSERDEDLTRAFTTAGTYTSALKEIVHDSALYRKMAASLVGQCSLIQTILGWHLQGLKEAAVYGKDALFYGEMAGDISLQIAAHAQLSWIYYYGKQGKKALEEIEEAAYLLRTGKLPLSPLLESSVQSTLAVRQALLPDQSQQAIRSLNQAHQSFFSTSGEGASAYYSLPSLMLEDGQTYLNLGRYDTALHSFAQVVDSTTLRAKMPVAERIRIEVLNNQTIASLKTKKKDLERSVHYWKAAMHGAKTLKSEQRYSEALRAYDIMEALWSDEKRVQDLQELTVHW